MDLTEAAIFQKADAMIPILGFQRLHGHSKARGGEMCKLSLEGHTMVASAFREEQGGVDSHWPEEWRGRAAEWPALSLKVISSGGQMSRGHSNVCLQCSLFSTMSATIPIFCANKADSGGKLSDRLVWPIKALYVSASPELYWKLYWHKYGSLNMSSLACYSTIPSGPSSQCIFVTAGGSRGSQCPEPNRGRLGSPGQHLKNLCQERGDSQMLYCVGSMSFPHLKKVRSTQWTAWGSCHCKRVRGEELRLSRPSKQNFVFSWYSLPALQWPPEKTMFPAPPLDGAVTLGKCPGCLQDAEILTGQIGIFYMWRSFTLLKFLKVFSYLLEKMLLSSTYILQHHLNGRFC